MCILRGHNNIYYIKAEEIQAAIKEYDKKATIKHNSYKTLPGLNYIIKITVNKTGVRFTASVTDWDKVESNDIYPEIDVSFSNTISSLPKAGKKFLIACGIIKFHGLCTIRLGIR